MGTIWIAGGAASGPTPLSAYDAALADANLHNYNLVPVSSVIPADATIERVGTAPDLGAPGGQLFVVEARATVSGPGHATAGLAWSREPDGPGLFYEESGEADTETVHTRLTEGLAAGERLRDWDFSVTGEHIESVDAPPGTYTTAVVLAVYGDATPIV